MAKKQSPKSRRPSKRPLRRARVVRLRASPPRAAIASIPGAERRDIGGVRLEVVRAGAARVKRMVYPPGFRWSTHMQPIVKTERCTHAHVGFLVSGRVGIEYADGCQIEFRAPQVLVIEPGHDGWVIGRSPAIVIEFDFERDTIARLGMPDAHRHA